MLTVRFATLDLVAGHRLLDLGCGAGRHAYEAARLGALVTAVDLSPAELAAVRERHSGAPVAATVEPAGTISVALADATNLPFPDGCFDHIIASEVLEHVGDDAAAAAEIARVLRPGGAVAVTVPAELPERVCWALSDRYHAPFVAGGHVRIYRSGQLRSRLQRSGLVPYAHHRTHALHSPYWWLRCAVGPEQETHFMVRPYRRLLEHEIMRRPQAMVVLERLAAPVLGKSLVVYARRPR